VTDPMRTERERTELEAYRDGELPLFARWRMARRLRRDPALARRLAALESLGTLLREVDAEAPTPDLWDGIRLRLVQEEVRREATAERAGGFSAWRRPIGFAAVGAVAAASFALAMLPGPEVAAPPGVEARAGGSVRWIDARGNPMMVLRDDREATIIWVPEQNL
jgi:anti-sigma factor RsiW